MLMMKWKIVAGVLVLSVVYLTWFANLFPTHYVFNVKIPPPPVLNKVDYNARMLALAHFKIASSSLATSTPVEQTGSTGQVATSTASTTPPALPISTATTSVSVLGRLWPVATVYPEVGALLPFKRIVAYYGNFYSKQMGVLGEYPTDTMLAMLASTTALWAAADPSTPVVPAIHYIAVVAQATAGKEGKYILRMPDDQIDHALDLAHRVNGIVFLDMQVGVSTLEHELPQLEKYLKMPQVHLGIDPEFSMKTGNRPGTVIGTYDADDINYAANYLATLVRENNLPPKIIVVHRFTKAMVTNYEKITPLPEVQIVMHMDGFGSKAKKYGTYNRVVASEPVQFMGIKLFYKNDTRPPADGLLSPAEVLSLTPAPIYIQYQ